jgi:hypothetical protein
MESVPRETSLAYREQSQRKVDANRKFRENPGEFPYIH